MRIVEIIRIDQSNRFGTFGVLRIDKVAFCVTLEPRDNLNRVNRSSIPAGQYEMRGVSSERFGETFEVLSVPGRTGILFHAGNVVEDTSGCILIGQHFGKLAEDRAILNSGETFRKFVNAIGANAAHLTIREVY
jgi:hypothetical protein